jgi:hypothetical protein
MCENPLRGRGPLRAVVTSIVIIIMLLSLVTGIFFFLVLLLLKQRSFPPLRLQVSDCNTFRIMYVFQV